MSESISKEHSRRAMIVLESLTGGIIDKERILKYYKGIRETNEKNRRESLIQALGMLMIENMMYGASTKELRIDNKKVASNEFGDVYRVAVFSYPNAKPVEFIVQIYKVVPKLDEEYYKYIIYLVDSSGNKKLLEDSEDLNDDGVFGIYVSLDEALGSAVAYSLSDMMVDYAIERSKRSISEGLFWGDKV